MGRAFVLLAAASCASATTTAPLPTARAVTAAAEQAPKATRAPVGKAHPDAAAIFARLQPDLLRCYVQALAATPEMTSGKLTLNVSSDGTGKTACVIPSDGMGITQDVADCMAARVAAEKLDDGAAWATAVPVVLRAGAIELGERAPDVFGMESIETVRMPDAFQRLESLLPEIETCIRGVDRSGGLHHVLVAARVGADGKSECALATSAGALPAKVGDCAAGVLRGVKFPPPKRGLGFVLVPINLLD